MKKITVLFCILLAGLSMETQAQGIQFKQGSFDELLTLAKNENKLIFIDFYTEWCGPCKLMSKVVFTDPTVAAFYNKEFICCKLDAENEGRIQAKKYDVLAYPSSVFVNQFGEMVYKKVGSMDAVQFVKIGKEALNMVNNTQSYVELRKMYDQKKTDELFLRTYIDKMIQYGDMPIDAIDAYLKVQSSMKENEVEMMEFLMRYSKYLICGGKAESVFKTNYKEYFDIATRAEEKALAAMDGKMVRLTRQHALMTQNAALYETFLSRWMGLNPKGIKEDANDFNLELLLLKKDNEVYKATATHYLDSIVSAKSLEQMRADDLKRYNDYVKRENGQYSLVGESVKKAMKIFEAEWQTESILKVGQYYLTMSSKKAEFKKLFAWSDYGKLLLPEDYRMNDFQSKIFTKMGNAKKALELKRQAVAMMAPTDKEIKRMKAELDEMEQAK